MKKYILSLITLTVVAFATDNINIEENSFTIKQESKTVTVQKSVISDAVAFSIGSGPEQAYLVADPQCKYCIKAAKKFQGKMHEYTLNVILLPLRKHKDSKSMISYILNGEDNEEKARRFEEILVNKDTTYKKAEYDKNRMGKYLKRIEPALVSLNAFGTPRFYTEENNVIDPCFLDQLLEEWN